MNTKSRRINSLIENYTYEFVIVGTFHTCIELITGKNEMKQATHNTENIIGYSE